MPSQGMTRRNFVKMFDADKTRMIVLPYGENTVTIYVKPFSSDTGTWWIDGQTVRIAISISHVSVLMCDKKRQEHWLYIKDKNNEDHGLWSFPVYAAESWTTKKLAGTKQGYLKYGAGEKHFEYHNNRTNTESPNWVGMNKILKDKKLGYPSVAGRLHDALCHWIFC